MHPAYLVNILNIISQNHTCTLRKAPGFDSPNDSNSKILLQKMVAGYRQSCMAILTNYASQCDRVCRGDSKRKINIKYFLILASNNNLSQVCRSGVCICRTLCKQCLWSTALNILRAVVSPVNATLRTLYNLIGEWVLPYIAIRNTLMPV